MEVSNKLCENYLNLGKAYQLKKDYSSAENYYKKSESICGTVGNKQGIAFSKRNLANLGILRKKKADSADLIKIQESKKAREEFNSKVDKESNQLEIAQSYISLKKFSEAKKILLKILPVFEKEKSEENLMSAYKLLTTVYNELRISDSANAYFQQYINMNDKLVNTSVINQSTELEKKY